MSNNQLPADVQERIKKDARNASDKRYEGGAVNFEYLEYEAGWEEGATAENSRAQKLADTLRGAIGTIIFWYEVLSQTEGFAVMEAEYLEAKNQSIARIENALQQWKEGKGVGDDK